MDLRVTFSNDLLSGIEIRFVPYKPIQLSGRYFEDWYWLFFTEGNFWSILPNKNVVTIPMTTESDKLFCGVDGTFK